MSTTSTQNPPRRPASHDLEKPRRERQLVQRHSQPRLQARRRRLERDRQPQLRRLAADGQAARPGGHLDHAPATGRRQGPQGIPAGSITRYQPGGPATGRPYRKESQHEYTTYAGALEGCTQCHKTISHGKWFTVARVETNRFTPEGTEAKHALSPPLRNCWKP